MVQFNILELLTSKFFYMNLNNKFPILSIMIKPILQFNPLFVLVFVCASLHAQHTNINVSGGQFSEPYFNFSDENGSIDLDTFEFIAGKSYRFTAVQGFSPHPFQIGSSPGTPSQYSSGGPLSSVGDELVLEIPSNFDPYSSPLHFYCTAHTSMSGQLIVVAHTMSDESSTNKQECCPSNTKQFETTGELDMTEYAEIVPGDSKQITTLKYQLWKLGGVLCVDMSDMQNAEINDFELSRYYSLPTSPNEAEGSLTRTYNNGNNTFYYKDPNGNCYKAVYNDEGSDYNNPVVMTLVSTASSDAGGSGDGGNDTEEPPLDEEGGIPASTPVYDITSGIQQNIQGHTFAAFAEGDQVGINFDELVSGVSAQINITLDGNDLNSTIVLSGKQPPSDSEAAFYLKRGSNVYVGNLGGLTDANASDQWTIDLALVGDAGGSGDGGNDTEEPTVDEEGGIPASTPVYDITSGIQQNIQGHTFAAFAEGDQVGINFDELVSGVSAQINITLDGNDLNSTIVLSGKQPPSDSEAAFYLKRGSNVYVGNLGGLTDANASDQWTIDLALVGDAGGSGDGGNDTEEPTVDEDGGIPDSTPVYDITSGIQQNIQGHTFAAFAEGDQVGINFDELVSGVSAQINITLDGNDLNSTIVLSGKQPPSDSEAAFYLKRGSNVYVGNLGGLTDANASDQWTIDLALVGDAGGSGDGGNDTEEPTVDEDGGIPDSTPVYDITSGIQQNIQGHTFAAFAEGDQVGINFGELVSGVSAQINITLDGNDLNSTIVLSGKQPPSDSEAAFYLKRGSNVYVGNLGGLTDANASDQWTIDLALVGDAGGSGDGGNDTEEPTVDEDGGIPDSTPVYDITSGIQQNIQGHTFAAFAEGDQVGINFGELVSGVSAQINITLDGNDLNSTIVLSGKQPPSDSEAAFYLKRGSNVYVGNLGGLTDANASDQWTIDLALVGDAGGSGDGGEHDDEFTPIEEVEEFVNELKNSIEELTYSDAVWVEKKHDALVDGRFVYEVGLNNMINLYFDQNGSYIHAAEDYMEERQFIPKSEISQSIKDLILAEVPNSEIIDFEVEFSRINVPGNDNQIFFAVIENNQSESFEVVISGDGERVIIVMPFEDIILGVLLNCQRWRSSTSQTIMHTMMAIP
jgi:2-keto-4-pentenoate hydratase